jgi:hypothetical protein
VCHEVKLFEEFHIQGAGHQYACKMCARSRARVESGLQKIRSYRSHLKGAFGLSPEDFDGMLIEQSGRCGICNNPMTKPCVDHDHSCCPGKKSCGRCIRKLLCNSCNAGIGYLRDDVRILNLAIEYLEAHRSVGESL